MEVREKKKITFITAVKLNLNGRDKKLILNQGKI